jgi:hypothetical protein
MLTYTLPRPTFNMLADFMGKDKAESFAAAIEQSLNDVQAESRKNTDSLRIEVKAALKDELKNELVTRDVFEERFKVLDERFKVVDERFKVVDERFRRQDFKLNVLIALMMIGLTFANPTFVELIKHVLR